MSVRGEGSALTVSGLAQQHGLELVRFAYLLCGDRHRAEDLLQDVLLNLHRRFPDTVAVDNPVGYARRVLDTRTGASADTGLQFSGIAVASSGVLALGGSVVSTTGPPAIVRLDTNDLPGLHC